MGYLQDNLTLGEDIIYQANIHWLIFVRPILLLLSEYLFYSALETGFIHWIGIILLILGLYSLLERLSIKICFLYAVTNKRVILKSGIIKRDALELMLHKCDGIKINQSLLGRIIGFGLIVITTGGATNSYRFVPDPIKFKNIVNEQIN